MIIDCQNLLGTGDEARMLHYLGRHVEELPVLEARIPLLANFPVGLVCNALEYAAWEASLVVNNAEVAERLFGKAIDVCSEEEALGHSFFFTSDGYTRFSKSIATTESGRKLLSRLCEEPSPMRNAFAKAGALDSACRMSRSTP